VPPETWTNVTSNITSVPDQEAFLVDATSDTSSSHRWIQAKKVELVNSTSPLPNLPFII